MPRATIARARWVAVAWKEQDATPEAAQQADRRLLQLQGAWRDGKGSTYRLELSEDGTALDVHTTRPTGEVLSTPSLIRVDPRREAPSGCVVWGRQGSRAQYTLGAHCEESLRWEHKGRPPFEWRRDAAADAEERAASAERASSTERAASAERGGSAGGAGEAQSAEAGAARAPEDASAALRALLGLPAGPAPRAEAEEEAERSREAPGPLPQRPDEDGRQAGLRLLRAVQRGGARAAAAAPPPEAASAASGAAAAASEGEGAAPAAAAEAASPAAAAEGEGAARAAAAEAASLLARTPRDAAGRDSEPEPADEFRVVGSAGSTTAGGSTGSTPKWPPPDLEHLEPEKLERAAQLLFDALSPAAAAPSSSSAALAQPAAGQREPPPPLAGSGASSNSGEEPGCVETIWQPLPQRWPALPAFPLVVHWHPNDPVNQMLLDQVSTIVGFHLAMSDLQEGSFFRSQTSSGGWVKLHALQALYHVRTLGANLWTLQRAVACNSTLELDASRRFVRLAGRRCCDEDEPAPWQ